MANKLELNWAGKHDGYALIRDEVTGAPVQVPYEEVQPRLLIEEGRYGDQGGDNIIISGENLYALKTLVRSGYAGQIKCIYIDPSYNTGNAFAHYDDALEYSLWLDMMRDRVELLNDLLADEGGSLWISIDDDECHYLKVLCDEIIGRPQFVANIVWQKRTSRENRAAIGSAHDHILLYAKGGAVKWKTHRNLLPPKDSGYSNPDNDPRGLWRSIPFSAQGFRKNQMYSIETSSGIWVEPPKGRCWGATEPEYFKLKADNRVYFPDDGIGRPRIKQFKGEVIIVLSRAANGDLRATITLTNPTSSPVSNVTVTLVRASTLDGSAFVDGVLVPQSFGTVNPNQTVGAIVTFPGTAGVPPGFTGLIRVDLSFTGGNYSDTKQVVTP